jgi:membrane protease YdiL (CAAX protease family)
MRSLIRSWPVRLEVVLVLAASFGYFVVDSLVGVVRGETNPEVTVAQLYTLLAQEIIAGVLVGAFLLLRGWTPQRLGLKPTLNDTLVGFAMSAALLVVMFSIYIIALAFHLTPPEASSAAAKTAHLPILVVIGASAVDALYEELFLCGYLISVARECNRLSLGVNASVAIRLLAYLYEGGVGAVGAIATGLICALWFARTGRLWPVLVAHAALDLAALLPFTALG